MLFTLLIKLFFFFFNDTATTEIYTLSLHDALPIADERALIETHTLEGERMLVQVGGLLGEVGHLVRSCHEHYDGSGYPDGLAGERIPLVARVVCCCDAFSAMTTDRPYRAGRSAAEAVAELQRCSGTQFDPRVVEALADVVMR